MASAKQKQKINVKILATTHYLVRAGYGRRDRHPRRPKQRQDRRVASCRIAFDERHKVVPAVERQAGRAGSTSVHGCITRAHVHMRMHDGSTHVCMAASLVLMLAARMHMATSLERMASSHV